MLSPSYRQDLVPFALDISKILYILLSNVPGNTLSHVQNMGHKTVKHQKVPQIVPYKCMKWYVTL